MTIERDAVDSRIEYDLIQDPCPSTADGTFLGCRWEFYSRWDHWDFTLSTDASVYPDGSIYRDMRPEELPACIFFRGRRFCRDGESKAGYIAKPEVQNLVRQCIQEFEQTRQASCT
jgi:hypothetical protein